MSVLLGILIILISGYISYRIDPYSYNVWLISSLGGALAMAVAIVGVL